MARQSVKGFVAGLKKMVSVEREMLKSLEDERDAILAKLNAGVAAQVTKIEALESVMATMTPAKPAADAGEK